MPSIASKQAASPQSGRSGLKEITGSKINIIESTPQRRRLRSDSAAVDADSPVPTSIKRKSPRRCIDSSPHTPPNLRSDSTVICVSPSSTPGLRKSARRCINSSPNSSPNLRSDSAAMCTSPVSTPNERKSARRCINSSPNTSPNGVAKECTTKLNELHISAVKSLSSNFVAKPELDTKDSLQLSAVKEALHVSTLPCTVVCREDEQKRVLDFCKGCIKQDKAGSLYICGCPGTGKSLSMAKVKKQLLDWAQEASFDQPDVLELQCTSLVTTSEIFIKVLGKLDQTTRPSTSASALQLIQKSYSQEQQSHPQKMLLIIADELDYLITRDRAVLHDLFMLTALPFSRCILIGISNAIDLADRFLPRLQSLNCKPMVITFRAYTKDQIIEILQERLMALPYVVFQPQALELCARKIAAASGDMRKALCICRSAIDLVEAELKATEAARNSPSENDEPIGDQTTQGREGSKRKETNLNLSQVRIDHMARALSRTFKSPAVDTIQSLPQHQQIIMCSAVKRLNGRKKDTTLGELYQSYLEVCKSMLIPGVGILEFSSMCQVLNDQGLLKLGQSREDKLRRIALKVDHTDIAFALQGIRLFRSCLEQ